MIKLTLTSMLVAFALASYAQTNFVIRGKIELLSQSKHVRIPGYDPVPIQPDGSFEIKGECQTPNIALILTDSSGASAIWLAPGEYRISCKEVRLPNHKSVYFRTPVLKGPADAELYNDFQNRQYDVFGKVDVKEHAIRYMDSVMDINNGLVVLCEMIRSVQLYAGDEATKRLIQRLTPELRGNAEIMIVEDEFKRKEKIKNEKAFERFALKDTAGSSFSLSDVSGKKAILIDFWASDCGPCRAGHPGLKKWYAKYAAKGLQIVSISIDEDKDKWLKAIKEDGIGDWVNVYDPHGFDGKLMKDYFIPFIPFQFLLDGNGNIVKVNSGQSSWIEEKDVAAMLDGGSGN